MVQIIKSLSSIAFHHKSMSGIQRALLWLCLGTTVCELSYCKAFITAFTPGTVPCLQKSHHAWKMSYLAFLPCKERDTCLMLWTLKVSNQIVVQSVSIASKPVLGPGSLQMPGLHILHRWIHLRSTPLKTLQYLRWLCRTVENEITLGLIGRKS